MSKACELTLSRDNTELISCANRLGYRDALRIQPATRFGALQGWETAILVTLALALAISLACFWWIRHRTS